MSTKKNASNPLRPMGPADVWVTGEAAQHLKNTIGQVVDLLSAGVRQVAVPVGQANAIKEAFTDPKLAAPGEGWSVEIRKCNGLIAELRFRAPDDPPLKEPTPLDLIVEARKAIAELLTSIPMPRP